MKTVIGIMGPSQATEKELGLAYELGKMVAKYNAVLLTGGMGGVMEEASRGAKENGGEVLAIAPIFDKADINQYVDIAVMTGMRSGRNFMNILSSDIVIAIGAHSAGTLSEIAFAIQQNKPLLLVGWSEAMKNYLGEYDSKNIYFMSSVDTVEEKIRQLTQ